MTPKPPDARSPRRLALYPPPDVPCTFTAVGQVQSPNYRNGLSPVARSHDVRGRLTDIGNVGSSAVPFSARYTYFPNGTVWKAQFRQPWGDHTQTRYRYLYSYGTARPNRLIAVDDLIPAANGDGFHDWDAGDVPANAIDYDAVGNLTSTTAAPYDLSSVEYDERNLPTSITTGGTTTTYRYSIEGQRTYKQNGTSNPQYYVLDGSVTLGVVDGGSLQY